MEKMWLRMDEDARRQQRRRQRQKCINCFKKMAAFLFSHIGLAAMVVAYSIAGGFLFKALEAPFEYQEKMRISEWKEKKIEAIWHLTDPLPPKENFTESIRAILLEFQSEVTTAVKEKGWDGKDSSQTTDLQWSFAGALLYAVTVITTIGYGHVAPKTTWGRLVTILYALVGIPLTFLYLSNIGNFLADCFRMFYKKICCDLCCCQKCERKKKRERMRQRKKREWAAQRNSVLRATSSVAATYCGNASSSSAASPVVDGCAGYREVPLSDRSSGDEVVVVLPGNHALGADHGHDNLVIESQEEGEPEERNWSSKREGRTVEEEGGCLGGCPSPTPGDSLPEMAIMDEVDQFGNVIKETAILDDVDQFGNVIKETAILDGVDEFGNVIKETAILDSDTDNEAGVPESGSANFGALSDPKRRHSLFTKLDDAKETDILEDWDDEVFVKEILAPAAAAAAAKSSDKPSSKGGGSDKTKKSKSKSSKAASSSGGEEGTTKSKSGTSKRSNSKQRHKDRSRSADKDKKHTDSKTNKDKDKLAAPQAESTKEKAGSKGKQKSSKKVKRKDTSKKRKDKEGRKKASSKTLGASESGDDTRHIMEVDDRSGADHAPSDDESFVTAPAESSSYVGDEGDAINGAYMADGGEIAAGGSASGGIATLATEDGVIKYDPNSTVVDVGTASPYDVELLECHDLTVDGAALGYVDMDYEDDEEGGKVTVPISICLIIIAGYIFGGSVLFTLWEEWDYLTGSYFCFITLSTIGFGDIVPGTDMKEWASSEKLVLCALWLAFGLSLLAMCFNLMQEEVKEKCKWVGHKLGLLRDEDEG